MQHSQRVEDSPSTTKVSRLSHSVCIWTITTAIFSINVHYIMFGSVGFYTQRILSSNLAIEHLINYSIFTFACCLRTLLVLHASQLFMLYYIIYITLHYYGILLLALYWHWNCMTLLLWMSQLMYNRNCLHGWNSKDYTGPTIHAIYINIFCYAHEWKSLLWDICFKKVVEIQPHVGQTLCSWQMLKFAWLCSHHFVAFNCYSTTCSFNIW